MTYNDRDGILVQLEPACEADDVAPPGPLYSGAVIAEVILMRVFAE